MQKNSNIEELIRKLAKSTYYQNIYAIAKDVPSMRLFKNNTDFTQVQMLFLKYVSFYYNLSMDIALGEVTDIVLQDDLYADAYTMYKNKKDKGIDRNKDVKNNTPSSQWIFKKTKKEK